MNEGEAARCFNRRRASFKYCVLLPDGKHHRQISRTRIGCDDRCKAVARDTTESRAHQPFTFIHFPFSTLRYTEGSSMFFFALLEKPESPRNRCIVTRWTTRSDIQNICISDSDQVHRSPSTFIV